MRLPTAINTVYYIKFYEDDELVNVDPSVIFLTYAKAEAYLNDLYYVLDSETGFYEQDDDLDPHYRIAEIKTAELR